YRYTWRSGPMSLRQDQRASRKLTRAARRNTTALKRACESVAPGTRQYESLENRLMMALVHEYNFNETVTDPNDPAYLTVTDALGTNNGTLVNVATGNDPGVE